MFLEFCWCLPYGFQKKKNKLYIVNIFSFMYLSITHIFCLSLNRIPLFASLLLLYSLKIFLFVCLFCFVSELFLFLIIPFSLPPSLSLSLPFLPLILPGSLASPWFSITFRNLFYIFEKNSPLLDLLNIFWPKYSNHIDNRLNKLKWTRAFPSLLDLLYQIYTRG